MNGRRRHWCAGTTATPGLSVQEGHAGVKSPYLPNSTIAVFLSGPFFFSLRCRSSSERVCCFSSSNSAGKDLKRCLHPVPDPSAQRFIACGCYGAITFYIYMSSSIVKDPGTSHKLLPCCRARQATRRTLRARGGGFIQGRRSLDERLCCPREIPADNAYLRGTEPYASESLLWFEDLIPSPQALRDGARVFVHAELRAPGSALRRLGGHGENCPPSQPAAQLVSGLERLGGVGRQRGLLLQKAFIIAALVVAGEALQLSVGCQRCTQPQAWRWRGWTWFKQAVSCPGPRDRTSWSICSSGSLVQPGFVGLAPNVPKVGRARLLG